MQFHYHVASQINLSITRQHIFKAMNAFTDICGLKKKTTSGLGRIGTSMILGRLIGKMILLRVCITYSKKKTISESPCSLFNSTNMVLEHLMCSYLVDLSRFQKYIQDGRHFIGKLQK